MPITKEWSFASRALLDAVLTNGTPAVPAARGEADERAARADWQRIIDRQLIEWGRDPSYLTDEGVDPPTKDTIQQAIQLAQGLQEQGFPPPDSVTLDPNGGIIFERRQREIAEVCHVWDDGTVEYQRFEGAKLVERRTF